jgi:hypothetical protein
VKGRKDETHSIGSIDTGDQVKWTKEEELQVVLFSTRPDIGKTMGTTDRQTTRRWNEREDGTFC